MHVCVCMCMRVHHRLNPEHALAACQTLGQGPRSGSRSCPRQTQSGRPSSSCKQSCPARLQSVSTRQVMMRTKPSPQHQLAGPSLLHAAGLRLLHYPRWEFTHSSDYAVNGQRKQVSTRRSGTNLDCPSGGGERQTPSGTTWPFCMCFALFRHVVPIGCRCYQGKRAETLMYKKLRARRRSGNRHTLVRVVTREVGAGSRSQPWEVRARSRAPSTPQQTIRQGHLSGSPKFACDLTKRRCCCGCDCYSEYTWVILGGTCAPCTRNSKIFHG